MSYLHPIRLHFAGRFRADVSTVNNNRQHFDNQNFNPNFQLPGNNKGMWQPAGTGAWRLLDCRVTSVHGGNSDDDIALSATIRESGDRPSAKIVDLDPDQQGVSMIFGLTVRLIDAQGRSLVQGDFEPAAFFDLRANRSSGNGDAGRSAYFQSVLTDVEWDDVTASPCLAQMKQASMAGKLSIRFITDGYQMGGPQRGYGRIVGTIGPCLEGEPHTFVLGRHLEVQTAGTVGQDDLEYAQAECLVDAGRRKLLVDVGNVLQVDSANGDFSNMGEITLSAGNGAALGKLHYTGAGGYASSAGIYEFPEGRTLTDMELAAIGQSALQLTLVPPGATSPILFAAERQDGFYARPEHFVFRLDPGTSARTDLIVSRFGTPFGNATPQANVFPFSLPDQSPLPDVAVAAKTDDHGRAQITITGVDPTNPRRFIDGQVYGIVFSLQESQTDPNVTINAERNFISVLTFDPGQKHASPGWDDVRPIFKQYADLYPRPHGPNSYAPFAGLPPSHPVVNLDDYDSVANFARRIVKALELPIEHPDHMPVTRDLSGGKRALLLDWLRNVGADGKPKRIGSPSVAAAAIVGAVAKPAARFASGAPKVNVGRLRHRPGQS